MAFVTCFFVLATALGWTLISALDRNELVPRPEKLMFGFGAGCIAFYFAVFFVGPVSLTQASMLVVMAVAMLLSGPALAQLVRAVRKRGLAARLGDVRAAACANPLTSLVWAATALSLALSLLQGMAPPNDYDSLNYHIGLPQRDIEQGFVGVNWEGHIFSFFPALSEHLYRLALAVAGEPAAQPVTGLFGIMLALATALVVRRLGFGPLTAAFAALMVIVVRVTVWELATCEVEPQLALYAALAFLAYMHWRRAGGLIWMILFGTALAGGTLVKYQGLAVIACFAPLVLWDLALPRHRPGRNVPEVLAGAASGIALLMPHFVRDFLYTGNPVFPLFHPLFVPGGPIFIEAGVEGFGRSRAFLDYLRSPWDISILPTYYFDGAMLGAPYFLAFAPLALFAAQARRLLPMLVVSVIFLACWYWGMTKQVRFLTTITPFLAAFAAIGLAGAWQNGGTVTRGVLLAAGLILGANQAMFVAIYAALRLPPALGLVTAADYHAKTPTLNGAFYGGCSFVRKNLGEGERVLSLLVPNSYYCPQVASIVSPALPSEAHYWLTGRPLNPLSSAALLEAMREYNIRFVILERAREFRSGPDSAARIVTKNYSGDRMGTLLEPATRSLKPLFEDHISAVYDALPIMDYLARSL